MTVDRVPNELWLEVFDQLPHCTLKDISLTYRTFSRLTRPLLFTHFNFHPYAVAGDILLLPSATHIAESLERLNFWFSPDIASLVHSCNIIPWRTRQAFSGTDSPYVLLAAFFDGLPRLTALRRLDAHTVHFTRLGVANLCRLPTLGRLQIDSCSVAAGELIDTSSSGLSLSTLSVRHNIISEDGIDHWIPLLRPDHLRELDVMCNLSLLGKSLDEIPSFPHLRELSIAMNLAVMSRNLALLLKLPSIRILEIQGWGEIENTPQRLDVPLLPLLEEYKGPVATLPIFLPLSSLTRLSTAYDNPHTFIAQLHQVRSPFNVTSLDMTFDSFDNATLDAICAFFPRLTALRARIEMQPEADMFPDDINPQAPAFFRTLAASPPLPPTLKHLALSWEFEYGEFDDEPTCGGVPDLAALREALLVHCPALAFLWLGGHDFLLWWTRTQDGTIDEVTSEDAEEVESMLRELIISWENLS